MVGLQRSADSFTIPVNVQHSRFSCFEQALKLNEQAELAKGFPGFFLCSASICSLMHLLAFLTLAFLDLVSQCYQGSRIIFVDLLADRFCSALLLTCWSSLSELWQEKLTYVGPFCLFQKHSLPEILIFRPQKTFQTVYFLQLLTAYQSLCPQFDFWLLQFEDLFHFGSPKNQCHNDYDAPRSHCYTYHGHN